MQRFLEEKRYIVKQIITVYVDKDMYKQFKIQSIIKNKSVSERINDFMKNEIEKGDYNDDDNKG